MFEEYKEWTFDLRQKAGYSPYYELRRRFAHDLTNTFTNILILVGTYGFQFKNRKDESYENTFDVDCRISLNGPAFLTIDEVEEIRNIVVYAKEQLKKRFQKGE